MSCSCEKHDMKAGKCNANTPPVLEVHSEECPVLFHTVNITAEQGTVETMPPTPGMYRNTRVYYEADNLSYLYDSDGVPQLLTVPGPAGGVNSVNGMQGEVILTNADLNAQGVLTAGANITIDANNEISATDTTYTDFVGTDGQDAGTAGLVPAPATTDADKFLKADGTWADTPVPTVQTMFYANVSESGNQRHIYKNPDMTGEVSAQELLDANEEGQVILRMSTSATPGYFNDAYLQNTYVGAGDYQFLFLDNRVYYEYDGSATSDTVFYYSATTVQFQMDAGAGISIADHHTISATNVILGGANAPTTSTAGVLGALYTQVDSGTPHLYMCTDVSGGTYTWTEITTPLP